MRAGLKQRVGQLEQRCDRHRQYPYAWLYYGDEAPVFPPGPSLIIGLHRPDCDQPEHSGSCTTGGVPCDRD